MPVTRRTADGAEYCNSVDGNFHCRHLLGHTQNHDHSPWLLASNTIRLSAPVADLVAQVLEASAAADLHAAMMRQQILLNRRRKDGSVTIFVENVQKLNAALSAIASRGHYQGTGIYRSALASLRAIRAMHGEIR